MHLYPNIRFKCLSSNNRVWIACIVTLIIISYFFLNRKPNFTQDTHRFTNFNNETGSANGELIVPNIIHFVVFENPVIDFIHFICILAAMKNQLPEKIYFHTNVDSFKGEYWTRLMSLKHFTDILAIKKIEMPTKIFDQVIPPEIRVLHGSDITRIRILMKYGGIYLNNDMYIVMSLNYYRKFEMAIGWGEGEFLRNQLIVAHKDARFLERWLHTYNGDAYDASKWYYNSEELPTETVLKKNPQLVHRVKLLFGTDSNLISKLFQEYWPDWRANFALPLLARYQYVLQNITEDAFFNVDFDDYNVQEYAITFREMVNEVIDF